MYKKFVILKKKGHAKIKTCAIEKPRYKLSKNYPYDQVNN